MAEGKGVAIALIAGAGALVVATIVVLITLSTMMNSNLLRTGSITVTGQDVGVYVNSTPYVLNAFTAVNKSYAVTSVANATGGGYNTVTSPNYTFWANNGTISNYTAAGTARDWTNVTINYTWSPPTMWEFTTEGAVKNMSSGVDAVSGKLPTVLLLGAVILLFGIIVLLVRQARSIGFMGGSSL